MIVEAASTSGLVLVLAGAADVILLDLGLPDIDGIEVIKSVRSWSMCPIIVISARSEDKDKIDALDAGADDYLTKPFSVDELLARLRSTMRRIQYLEDNAGKETPRCIFRPLHSPFSWRLPVRS